MSSCMEWNSDTQLWILRLFNCFKMFVKVSYIAFILMQASASFLWWMLEPFEYFPTFCIYMNGWGKQIFCCNDLQFCSPNAQSLHPWLFHIAFYRLQGGSHWIVDLWIMYVVISRCSSSWNSCDPVQQSNRPKEAISICSNPSCHWWAVGHSNHWWLCPVGVIHTD